MVSTKLIAIHFRLLLHYLLATVVFSNETFVSRPLSLPTYCSPSTQIQFPTSALELQSIVLHAIAINSTVKVIGNQHSVTDIICTEGIPVSTKFINYSIINHAQNTATFGSGLKLKAALDFLHSEGRSLIHTPGYGGLTIAGALGTGAHGSSLLHPTSLSDQVVSVTLVDGQGKIRTISKNSKNTDEFFAISLHLGLLGAIIDVTLNTVVLFKMTVENFRFPEHVLWDGSVLAEAKLFDFYELCWYPSSKSVVVTSGNYTEDLSLPGNAKWTSPTNSVSPALIKMAKVGNEIIQMFQFRQVEFAVENFSGKIFYEKFKDEEGNFVNPATGYAHNLLQESREEELCHELDSLPKGDNMEMAFELKELPNVVRKIKKILEEVDSPPFTGFGIFIRFARASENLMSIEYGQDVVHLEWYALPRLNPYKDAKDGLAAYQAIMQAILEEHGGRPHWGKNGQFVFTKEVLQRITPNLERFSKVMETLDPEGIFMNKFGRRLMGTGDELNWDPEAKHCALQNYCFCNKDEDCAEEQTCEKVMEGGYRVCRNKKPGLLLDFDLNDLSLAHEDLKTILNMFLPVGMANLINPDVLKGILQIGQGFRQDRLEVAEKV